MTCRSLRRAHVALVFTCLLAGCSNYALPHHAYAPLLERGGQLEVRGSAGVNLGAGTPELVLEGQMAGSPVDGFVIAGGVTTSVIPGEKTSNHFDGELALGAYLADDPSLRAEVLAGCAVGYGTGFYFGEEGDARLWGTYTRPFVQGTLAGVTSNGFFTIGGGLRVAANFIGLNARDVAPVEDGPSFVMSGFREALHVDPFVTARFGDDVARLEVGLGTSVMLLGSSAVGALMNVWFNVALRLRFDLAGPPTGSTAPSP
ncbi:MAG: hypothetical protein AB8I08_14335 [Sandaracinaceae bacterium]